MTGILNVEAFKKVHLEIIQWPAKALNMSVECYMGEFSGTTLGVKVDQFRFEATGQIHSYDVTSPTFSVVLIGGPPHASVPVQAWIFVN